MNDEQIIDLYWSRQENAITETSKKYGKYCNCIALHFIFFITKKTVKNVSMIHT